MAKKVIAVSGSNGQLGRELQQLAATHKNYDFVFATREELDITTIASVTAFFNKYTPAYFINCAAYTAVDKAEQDQIAAFTTNAEAVGTIARVCNEFNTVLIHFSTDYVFNGNGSSPYLPEDKTEPINYYGYSKWLGEELAINNCPGTIIIRTSWVYSSYGHNFVKTMLRLMKERTDINVVNDQVGCPTYAKDLAEAVLHIINRLQSGTTIQSTKGVYHFSNTGVISWYDFAVAIKQLSALNCAVHPIPSSAFPTPAKRPAYSVMDTEKINRVFSVPLKNWRQSLQDCLQLLQR